MGTIKGRPVRTDIDMAQVYALLPVCSVRKISRLMGVPFNTLYYRLGGGLVTGPNPFCIKDRLRMRTVQRIGWHYFYCPQCGENTKPQRDTPLPAVKLNPFCVSCHGRMYAYQRVSGEVYFRCRRCRASTIYRPPRTPKPRGAPLRKIDHERASKLLQDYPVLYVAEALGVHRNVLYNHISKGLCTGRPFRTWTPRPGWSPPLRDVGLLYWPYMKVDDPRYEGVIREVNEAVSREIPDAIRSDICQEIVVSVLMGEVTQKEIKSAVKSHMRRHFKMFPTKGYQVVSLDAPIRSNGYGSKETALIDMIDADSYHEKIATTRYSDILADCSTTSDLAERLADRWNANRLTEDRKSYSTFSKASGSSYSDPQYERIRRKYQLFNGRVHAFDYDSNSYGNAWTVENALPEELRQVHEEENY